MAVVVKHQVKIEDLKGVVVIERFQRSTMLLESGSLSKGDKDSTFALLLGHLYCYFYFSSPRIEVAVVATLP